MKRNKGLIRNVIDYLYLKDVGFLELMFALTPLLSGYGLGSLPLSLLMWFVLIVIVVIKGKVGRLKLFKPLVYFAIYWLLHTVMIMVIDDVNLNGVIAQLFYFLSVFILFPVIDLNKLKGCLNWIAIISIIGLLYQWTDVLSGNGVHQLEIPGLTIPQSRLESFTIRPSSFFGEPASFVAFMLGPLFFSLLDKKYIWVISIILSVFLTTSTTGIFVSFIMLGASLLTAKKVKVRSWLVALIIGGGLFYALTNLDVFDTSVQKIENTDASTNVRLSQGLYVVSTMQPSEYIFGVPYSSSYNYCKSGRATDVAYYGDNVFMPTFWLLLLLYGVVGLCLYLNIYIQILKKDRRSLILIMALFAVLFSSSYSIGVEFIYTLIILLIVTQKDNCNTSQGNHKIICR